jgi:hypothetical protein
LLALIFSFLSTQGETSLAKDFLNPIAIFLPGREVDSEKDFYEG